AWTSFVSADEVPTPDPRKKTPARVRAVFLYPPSKTFANDPDGWWSWPGNEYDAEGRHRRYGQALQRIEKKLGMTIDVVKQPVATDADVERIAKELKSGRPDGLLLVMFYNRSLAHADRLLKAAAEIDLPTVFYIGLGVKHGQVGHYRRPGVYFIQAMDDFDAIEYGMRMIHARKQMAQSLLLSITEAKRSREAVEPFFGTTVRVIPFARYAERFKKAALGPAQRRWIEQIRSGAKELRGLSNEAYENAARAHVALTELLKTEGADGLTMNCLRRGMLKPCISFSQLNSHLIPAACENDFPALYTQQLGQLLLGRPGFQHNPAFETERNHYYGSHCTCPTKLDGPDCPSAGYLLRRFAHTNEGSAAIQVFWRPYDPVTMVRYYSDKTPSLDVYSGRVIKSHPMPPAAGCTTNVEIAVTNRDDVCQVKGHHNLLFCGDFARNFKLFAQLYKMELRS
ncbi:MAG: hypothetical protein JXM70_20025, partial [Pirellulales bacterium]|nr:hypothetical protein [Pirellulales bacterium]